MTLEKYKSKRNFDKTTEPEGEISSRSEDRFVIQEHHASHLHYDFRLEMEGVLKSWAVPKGVPEKTGQKHLAVQTEDHPIEYVNFSGTIAKGEYGAGDVKIWDSGSYELLNQTPKSLEFKLNGKKLSGVYMMIKANFAGEQNSWLIWKKDLTKN